MSELEFFLFGGVCICNDGTYRPVGRRIIEDKSSGLNTGDIEIDYTTGEFRTYNKQGKLDAPQEI